MRLLDRLLVLLFVRRKAQEHARAVLADKRGKRKPAGDPGKPAALVAAEPAVETPAPVAAASGLPAAAPEPADTAPAPASTAGVVVPLTPREALIRDALAARKTREAEWNALTPEQQERAIAGLGEDMSALVRAFRAA